MTEQKLLFRNIKLWVSEHKGYLIVAGFLFVLVWFPWIFQTEAHVDSEMFILKPYDLYNWKEIGRQGMILTKKLFHLEWYNPFFEKILGYLTIFGAGGLFPYLFSCFSGKNDNKFLIFPLICFTGGIMAEQFYFDLQLFEMAIGYVLTVFSVLFSYRCAVNREIPSGIISIVCMLWSFSTYQTFTILHIVVCIVCFLLLYLNWEIEGHQPNTDYFSIVLVLVVLFAISFCFNIFLTNQFFSSSDYLSGQIMWGKISTDVILNNIAHHILYGFTGSNIFFTKLYSILAIATVLLVFLKTVKHWNKCSWMVLCGVLVLQISPYLLTVVMGTVPAARAQLVYPMLLACNCILLFCYTRQVGALSMLAGVLSIMVCFTQIQASTRLVYTDILTMKQDIRLAESIQNRIEAISSNGKPIAFIGEYVSKLNPSTVHGELIGTSIFSMSEEVQPYYYYSSDRACDLLRTQGFQFTSLSDKEKMREARKNALDMPVWPMEGSVVETSEYIIVKLSEDLWPEDLESSE